MPKLDPEPWWSRDWKFLGFVFNPYLDENGHLRLCWGLVHATWFFDWPPRQRQA